MNRDRGFLQKRRGLDGACLSVEDPRGARHWGAASCHKLHMRCQASMHCLIEILLPLPHRSPRQLSLFLFPIRYQPLTDVGPVELWATR